ARDIGGARAGDQGLGRDAASVDAGPAYQLALDDGGLPAGAGEPHGECRPGLTCPNNDRVVVFTHAQRTEDGGQKTEDRRQIITRRFAAIRGFFPSSVLWHLRVVFVAAKFDCFLSSVLCLLSSGSCPLS